MAKERADREEQENLLFLHAGKITGFRSSGLSAYNNVDPHTVVRELVQNALDASIQAKRKVVRVVFDVAEIAATEIPAREQYREHFKSAVRTQRDKGNAAQAKSIIDTIKATLKESRVPVLWVLDNGIGLDDDGTEKLLGDGQSGKADESTAGSYGNGHMTSFPASDLRYVVYGGVHKAGRTVSGHAILASHQYKGTVYGEDGYLAEEVRANDLFNRFEFYDGSEIPVLRHKLDWVEREFETGSVVGIFGFNRFNRFRNDEEVLAVIETVVATHFTPLIRDGAMEVELRRGGSPVRTVHGNALERILERRKDRVRRDRNSIGPSGGQAWETLQTLNPEHRHTIETQSGKVRFHLRPLARGTRGGTHLQLFRNGMWITNEVPHNRPSDYQNVVPFNGIILLEPGEAKDACGLVGTFEGPRHIYIDLTIQSRGSPERRALDRFLTELREQILELVPPLDAEEHDPGFFSIEVTGDGIRSDPRARPPGTGTPEPAPRRPPSVGPRRGSSGRRSHRRRHRSRRIEAQVTALKEAGGIRLRAKPLEDAANAELRVVLSDGSDETCDTPAPDQYLEIERGAQVGGQPVTGYVKDQQGARRAVLLGSVAPDGRELDVWIPCQPVDRGDIRVELVRAAPSRDEA